MIGLLKIVKQVGTDKTGPQYLASGEFENLFGGIGKVKGKVVKLHIDPDVQPKQQPHHQIPFHARQDVEKELERLKNLDIIEKVTSPTPWVSPILVVPKSSGQSEVTVYGHIFSSKALRDDPEKIEAITNMSVTENVSEVKSLLRMAQYVSRYIPEYAMMTAPLRALTKTPWQWSDEQQHAFDKLKDSLGKSHVMPYFYPAQETKVIVNASPISLGGLLTLRWQGYQLRESSTQ